MNSLRACKLVAPASTVHASHSRAIVAWTMPERVFELAPTDHVIVPGLLVGDPFAQPTQGQRNLGVTAAQTIAPWSHLTTRDGFTFALWSGALDKPCAVYACDPRSAREVIERVPVTVPTMPLGSVLPGLDVIAPTGERNGQGDAVWRLARTPMLVTRRGVEVSPLAVGSRLPEGTVIGDGIAPAGEALDGTLWWRIEGTHPQPGAPWAPLTEPGAYVVALPAGGYDLAVLG